MRARIKWWWHRLWIRKDEFHSSLEMDTEIALTVGVDKYLKDLVYRRDLAHRRDLPLTPPDNT